MNRLITASLLITGALAGTATSAQELLVFGAASLTESLQDAGKQFEAQGGPKVTFSFASSSDLARQIEAGAPADVFFSADTLKMDSVEKAGLANGTLYGVKVTGLSNETDASSVADGTRFTGVSLGDVRNKTGATLQSESVTAGVTGFNRPECRPDGRGG